MKLAISSARKGNLFNSAIVLEDDKVIATSESLVVTNNDATDHSERMLVSKVCKKKRSNYTPGLTMVTVVEPCLMCLSACSWAGYTQILFIIPTSKYIKKMPWMSDTKDLNKNSVLKHLNNPIKVIHLKELEEKFSKNFEKEMERNLK